MRHTEPSTSRHIVKKRFAAPRGNTVCTELQPAEVISTLLQTSMHYRHITYVHVVAAATNYASASVKRIHFVSQQLQKSPFQYAIISFTNLHSHDDVAVGCDAV